MSLQQEIAHLGLRSICFEPGYFRTDFLAADNRGQDKLRTEDYRQLVEASIERYNRAFPHPSSSSHPPR